MATHLFDSGERAIRADASEKDLHHLRLAAKKSRYTVELFATSCGPAVNDWLERATRAPGLAFNGLAFVVFQGRSSVNLLQPAGLPDVGGRRLLLLAQDAAVKAVQFHPQGVAVGFTRAFPPAEQRPRGFQAGRTEILLDPVAWGVAGVAVGAAADAALHLAVGVGLKAV